MIVPTLPRGNASRDAPRSSPTTFATLNTAMTQSFSGCIPTQSVGTIPRQNDVSHAHQ